MPSFKNQETDDIRSTQPSLKCKKILVIYDDDQFEETQYEGKVSTFISTDGKETTTVDRMDDQDDEVDDDDEQIHGLSYQKLVEV